MSARVLIGCERSGVLRRAFLALGIDAWSCDLEPPTMAAIAIFAATCSTISMMAGICWP
jgi:hypothetical protein